MTHAAERLCQAATTALHDASTTCETAGRFVERMSAYPVDAELLAWQGKPLRTSRPIQLADLGYRGGRQVSYETDAYLTGKTPPSTVLCVVSDGTMEAFERVRPHATRLLVAHNAQRLMIVPSAKGTIDWFSWGGVHDTSPVIPLADAMAEGNRLQEKNRNATDLGAAPGAGGKRIVTVYTSSGPQRLTVSETVALARQHGGKLGVVGLRSDVAAQVAPCVGYPIIYATRRDPAVTMNAWRKRGLSIIDLTTSDALRPVARAVVDSLPPELVDAERTGHYVLKALRSLAPDVHDPLLRAMLSADVTQLTDAQRWAIRQVGHRVTRSALDEYRLLRSHTSEQGVSSLRDELIEYVNCVYHARRTVQADNDTARAA